MHLALPTISFTAGIYELQDTNMALQLTINDMFWLWRNSLCLPAGSFLMLLAFFSLQRNNQYLSPCRLRRIELEHFLHSLLLQGRETEQQFAWKLSDHALCITIVGLPPPPFLRIDFLLAYWPRHYALFSFFWRPHSREHSLWLLSTSLKDVWDFQYG